MNDIDVKISSLKFAIRDSKHDFLYKTLRPLATALVKKQIQKAIKDTLRTGLEYIDGQLVAVRDRMAEAKVTEGQSRTEVLKDVRFHLYFCRFNLTVGGTIIHSYSNKGKKKHLLSRPIVVHTLRWLRTRGILFLFRRVIPQDGSTEPLKLRRARRLVKGGGRTRKFRFTYREISINLLVDQLYDCLKSFFCCFYLTLISIYPRVVHKFYEIFLKCSILFAPILLVYLHVVHSFSNTYIILVDFGLMNLEVLLTLTLIEEANILIGPNELVYYPSEQAGEVLRIILIY